MPTVGRKMVEFRIGSNLHRTASSSFMSDGTESENQNETGQPAKGRYGVRPPVICEVTLATVVENLNCRWRIGRGLGLVSQPCLYRLTVLRCFGRVLADRATNRDEAEIDTGWGVHNGQRQITSANHRRAPHPSPAHYEALLLGQDRGDEGPVGSADGDPAVGATAAEAAGTEAAPTTPDGLWLLGTRVLRPELPGNQRNLERSPGVLPKAQ